MTPSRCINSCVLNMPHAHVLCHITDALSLVAGSGVCANVCLCLLNHVVVSHEDYLMFFSDVLQPHIRISHHQVILSFLALWVIVNECECDQVGKIEEQVVSGVVTVCVCVCVIVLRCYFYPLSSCSCLSVARSSVLGWSSPEIQVQQMHTSLLLWMVVWFRAHFCVYLNRMYILYIIIISVWQIIGIFKNMG